MFALSLLEINHMVCSAIITSPPGLVSGGLACQVRGLWSRVAGDPQRHGCHVLVPSTGQGGEQRPGNPLLSGRRQLDLHPAFSFYHTRIYVIGVLLLNGVNNQRQDTYPNRMQK